MQHRAGTWKYSLSCGYHHQCNFFIPLRALVAASRNLFGILLLLLLTTTIKEHTLRILKEILCLQVLVQARFYESAEDHLVSPLSKLKIFPIQAKPKTGPPGLTCRIVCLIIVFYQRLFRFVVLSH